MKTETKHPHSGSVMADRRKKNAAEGIAQTVFAACAFFVILAVASITLYLLAKGVPALLQVGPGKILLGTVWKPTAAKPQYGIFHVILTSLAGTALAVLLGVPVGILTAVFLAEIADRRLAAVVKPAVELLAGIPSVLYGLLGLTLLNPLIYRLELVLFRDSLNHRFTGGANLLSAALVLAVMILPTVISVSETAIRSVPPGIRAASLALGGSRVQTVFRAVLPAAKSGIATAIVLGVGRAVGEAAAIALVAGGCVNPPFPFRSVRFLATAIVSEMGYAAGRHRQMLFTIGLVLFSLLMAVNAALTKIRKAGTGEHG